MEFYVTGNGFIKYTTTYWKMSKTVLDSKYTLQGFINDGFTRIYKG